MQIGSTRMVRRRVEDDGNVTTGEVRADDHGGGKLYLPVDADIAVGDEVSYTLPNGTTRAMTITKHDVLQAPPGFGGSSLDHTVCEYEVASGRRLQRPQRVSLPNLHDAISDASGAQFAGGHYDSAVFEAFKAVEDRVRKLTGQSDIGKRLMTAVFNEQNPQLDITSDNADKDQKDDEREGFKFLFMGCALALRNTRGHGPTLQTGEQEAMEMLATASLLMRALDRAELRLAPKQSKLPKQKLPPGIGGAVSRSGKP
ncbi:TIGR02391 family protein [Mycobacterium talmoniae]|uniref:Conserved hypothetical protein CHP02391 domain-containing protein n=1 Tax=Mycobacterium talmoniae TaxID=1858794 RepID=A0A2S8BG11_9MYCO|nr:MULTISPECIES: TIGR02391 family protein [Mycobacterium]PQM45611.1 hypothetical protein C1Y40_04202 [Mycobacterium talmoniae]TDH48443.1 TIGR02391 family protein [Mycobacterium eburneum]